jgi:hypothetical protein
VSLPTLPTEQVHLYLHELEGILNLLREIVPAHLPSEESTRYETVLEQAYVLEDQITFEIARRQLMSLQAKSGAEESTLLEA